MRSSFFILSALALAVQAIPQDDAPDAQLVPPSGSSDAAPTPSIGPGAPCKGDEAYCAGNSGETNIIFRCNNGKLQPGNCNDNLSQPEFGAVCLVGRPGVAKCEAVEPTARVDTPLIFTESETETPTANIGTPLIFTPTADVGTPLIVTPTANIGTPLIFTPSTVATEAAATGASGTVDSGPVMTGGAMSGRQVGAGAVAFAAAAFMLV